MAARGVPREIGLVLVEQVGDGATDQTGPCLASLVGHWGAPSCLVAVGVTRRANR